MKKRYFLYAFIAFELAALPVSAKIINEVLLTVPAQAASVMLPAEPGLTRLVVVSNTPFVISAADHAATYRVEIIQNGHINETPFGDKAQMPGANIGCAITNTSEASVIYAATQRTAVKRGDVLDQSVMVEIRYPEDAQPAFDVVTMKDGEHLPLATLCQPRLASRT